MDRSSWSLQTVKSDKLLGAQLDRAAETRHDASVQGINRASAEARVT